MAKQAKKSTKSKNDNYEDMEEQEGHKQEGGKKVAETDADDQREAQEDGDQGDPFEQMMKEASRNARYTVAFIPNQGTVDKNDPTRVTPDEIENMPKTRKKA